MKVKICVTIDKELDKWLEQKIKKKVYANKSHGINYAIHELKEREKQK